MGEDEHLARELAQPGESGIELGGVADAGGGDLEGETEPVGHVGVDEVLRLRPRPRAGRDEVGHLGGFAGEHELGDAVDVTGGDEIAQGLEVRGVGVSHLGGEAGERCGQDERDLLQPGDGRVPGAQQPEETSGGHRDAEGARRGGRGESVGERLGDDAGAL